MRKITLLLFLIIPAGCFIHTSDIYAQPATTSLKEYSSKPASVTRVIFSIDPKNNGVNGIFLQDADIEAQLYSLKSECYRCEFYEGSIEGPFIRTNLHLKPGKNAILTIHTMQNLMPGKVFDPGSFPPGSRFNLLRIKSTVIDNQKGSFKLRIN